MLCGNDASKLTALHNRFSSPVYPGETLVVDMWRTGSNSASYRAKVAERDVVVLSHGYAEFK
jgi:acyl dehydratase